MQAILQFFWILFGNFAAIVEIKAIAPIPWRHQCTMKSAPFKRLKLDVGPPPLHSAVPQLCPSNGPR